MQLDRVTLQGNYLRSGERRFIPVGAHWVPAKTALQWPQLWNIADIEQDFAKMRDLEFTIVRFDLFWAWFEPRPGDYSEEAFAQFDSLIALAKKYGIYLHPTLFIGGEVGEAFWDIPWRQGRHPHEDPDMLRTQTDHAAEFARRYKGETAILAWDLTDEPPYWVVWGKTTDAMAINWTRLLSWAIRRQDPDCLVCVGTSMEDIGRGAFRPDIVAAEVDFLSSHPYPIYALDLFPDPMLSERGSYCAAFQATLNIGAGRPMMIHEYGASSAQYDPERVALYDRVVMYSGLAQGAMGFLPWCFTDAAPELFARAPYLRAPHETQFGVTSWDGQDRPSGREVRNFAALLKTMNLEGIEPARAEAAIIIPHEWAKPFGDMSKLGLSGPASIPYTSIQDCHAAEHDSEDNAWLMGSLLSSFILCRRAGYKVAMPREYGDWRAHDILFLPSPLTATERNNTHVHTSFWEKAKQWVQEGKGLYASLCADAAIPDMASLFGASLSDHFPVDDSTITITEDFCGLKKGEAFSFKARGGARHWPASLSITTGRLIAVDQDGRPAIVTHELGKGKTLLCAYPIEQYLGTTPCAFEQNEQTHRLYKAFGDWLGVHPRFCTDCPSVEIAALDGESRGYAVLVNHSAKKETLRISTSRTRTLLRAVAPDARGASNALNAPSTHTVEVSCVEQGLWTCEIGPYEGMLLEWEILQ